VTAQPPQEAELSFICPETGSEHRFGYNAVDVGHGARPSGPQICLNCRETLQSLLRQSQQQLLDRVQKEVIGEDSHCEKGHEEYFDWCSYCSIEREKSDLRAFQLSTLQALQQELGEK
jgi:hypothetical protein